MTKKRKATDVATQSPDQMVKPLEAMNLKSYAPLIKGDRRIFNMLIDNAWKEIANDQWHSIPTSFFRFGNNSYHSRLHETLRRLMATIFEQKTITENGDIRVQRVQILGATDVTEKGILKYRFPPEFIEVISNSTQWAFVRKSVVFKMKSRYSISMYEWAESRFRRRAITETVSIEELRKILGVEDGKYKAFDNFRRRILIPAMDEINCLADHNIIFEPIKNGRSVTAIKFSWGAKSGPDLNRAETARREESDYSPRGEYQKVKDTLVRLSNGVSCGKDPNDTKTPDLYD